MQITKTEIKMVNKTFTGLFSRIWKISAATLHIELVGENNQHILNIEKRFRSKAAAESVYSSAIENGAEDPTKSKIKIIEKPSERLISAYGNKIIFSGITAKFGNEFRYPCSYEASCALRIADRLASEGGHLEIYDQAETGSIYGLMFYGDGSKTCVRIADHPTRTTVAIVERSRIMAMFDKMQRSI